MRGQGTKHHFTPRLGACFPIRADSATQCIMSMGLCVLRHTKVKLMKGMIGVPGVFSIPPVDVLFSVF